MPLSYLGRVENSGHQLHTLLQAVVGHGSQRLHQAWASVLEADYDSSEFVRRHAAVVALLADFAALVYSDHRAARRERNLRYAASWWIAVVSPDMLWNQQGHQAAALISQTDLDALANAADALDAGADRTHVDEEKVEGIRASAVGLAEQIAKAGLPRELQMRLAHDVENLLWCLDHIALFGPAAVGRAGEQAIGSVGTALNRVIPGRADQVRKWLANLVLALAAFTGVATEVDLAIEAGQNAWTAIDNLFDGDSAPDESPAILEGEIVDDLEQQREP